jgi:hypothetical protein
MGRALGAPIPTGFIDQFDNTLYHLLQQKDSKFQQAVDIKPITNAEDKAFDAIGKLALVEKTERNPKTPITDTTHERRWVNTTPFHQGVLIDRDDDLNRIIEPTSDIMTELVNAVNRKKDDIILASIDADVVQGRTSKTGAVISWASQDGNVQYTGRNTGRTIIYNSAVGNANAADTGLTVEKAELVREYFANNDADESTPIWGAISPRQATNLFGQEEYVNNDYSNGKPLTTGRIIMGWHGINWIVSTKIVAGTNNDTASSSVDVVRCPFWLQSGLILGVQDMISTEISIRSDLSYSKQIYVHMNMGGMRRDEDRVVYVETIE